MKTRFLSLSLLLVTYLMLGGGFLNNAFAQENYFPCTGGTYQYDNRIIQVIGPGPTQLTDGGLNITFGEVPGDYELFFEDEDYFTVTVFRNQVYPYQLAVSGNLCQGYVNVTMAGSDPAVYYYIKKVNGDEIGGTIRYDRGPITWGITEAGTYQVYAFMDFYTCSDQDRQLVGSFTVQPATPLIVNAGADRTINLPQTTITITGSTTTACPISTYQWTKQSGPNISMGGTNGAILTLTNLIGGNYTFRLTATAGNMTAFDDVGVTIVDLPPLKKDSLALVDLYQNCGGLNWINKSGWLTGRLNQWYGITVANGRVTSVSFIDNGLQGNIPGSFGNLSALKELYLDGNPITSLPESFGNLQSLEVVYILNSQLTSLPQSISNLKKIKTFVFNDNKIENIPSGIGGLENVTILVFANNKITNAPSSIGKLKKLEILRLENNKISSIPDSLKFATSLYRLILDNNPLNQVTNGILDLPKLNDLRLKNTKIGFVTPSINKLILLKNLDIRSTGLTLLPNEISALINLEYIHLSGNSINEFPPSMKQLIKLRDVILDSCNLTNVPDFISYLPAIEQITISNNKITGVPETLKNLSTLRKLYIQGNRLDFEDLEPVFSWPNFSKLSTFNYSPQASLNLVSNTAQKKLSVLTNGVNNKYIWKKNGINISSIVSSSVILSPAEYEANDEYECIVTNTAVTGVTLSTNKKRPKIENPSIGDFISKKSGNWNDYSVWKVFDGYNYNDAVAGQLPGINNSVFLEQSHSIAINQNAQCRDLNLNAASDVVRLDTKENVLDVYGKLRLYSSAYPGIHSTGAGIPGWIRTGTNGRIRLKGATNRVITEKDEFSSHINMKGWTLEVDLGGEVTGVLNSSFRANDVIITSGKLEVKSPNFILGKL